MRADRLLKIMLLLAAHGCLTTKELSARLEVSVRTIHRDMDALSAAGIPVYAERGVRGGWKLAAGYRTDWAGLNRDELIPLLAAAPGRHMDDLGWGPKFEAALLKLLASLSPTLRRDVEHVRQRLYVDAAGWHPYDEAVPLLPLLQEAVWTGRQMIIDYASGSGNAGPRTVHPLGLVLKGSIWYLVAVPAASVHPDTLAGSTPPEPRTYRVSRISRAECLPDPAVRPEGFDLAAYWERSVRRFREDLPRYPVRAIVHAEARPQLERTRFVRIAAWGRRSADGMWQEADLEFATLESACGTVMSFGTRLHVLEPAELRAAVVDAARKLIDQYEQERDGSDRVQQFFAE